MDNVYTQVELPITINIPPRMLHKNLYHELEKAVKHRLEGTCVPKIGYIKPGSVQIVKKQLGKSEGSHLTGNITYHVQVRCAATHPAEGQLIPCMVIGKNDIGVLAANYQFPAYTIFIMRMPDDTSDALDRIQKNSYIEVKVLGYVLKAANVIEKTKSEYWIVCALTNAKATENRYQILPDSIKPRLLLNYSNIDIATINEKRDTLSNGMYLTLEETKQSIQKIRSNYINMLANEPSLIDHDIFIQSMISRSKGYYIIGKIVSITPVDDTTYLHNVNIYKSSNTTLSKGDEFEIEISYKSKGKIYKENHSIGDVVVYLDYNEGRASSHFKLDIWGRHIKYIVNKTEMVHASSQYIIQLTNIIMKDGISYNKQGRMQMFEQKITKKPVATLIYKNPHVLSRAYYKMKEIQQFFGTSVFRPSSMKIACIAECPGGFIQALLDHRVYNPSEDHQIETGIKDDISCISIGIDCPPWESLDKKVRKSYDYVHIRSNKTSGGDKNVDKTNLLLIGGVTTNDESGNILSRESRERFYKEFTEENGGKADLITGDAGIERDKTETTEEMDTHKLLLSEIIMALHCQKDSGCFVLKIYDMATEFTVNMLEVLSYCYEEIGLFKPDTSRSASSEKYLICKNFHVTSEEKEYLLIALEQIMDHALPENFYLNSMIAAPNQKMIEAIINYNSYYMKQQVSFIETGRNYALLYNNAINSTDSKSREKMIYEILAKVGMQTSTAQDFYHDINMKWQ
jgi:23S rRNA U2552 (ribose-2'-O)-methylase RlmE/FtsJ/DNA-directed RNA polymerase subunit E'/Rpb7